MDKKRRDRFVENPNEIRSTYKATSEPDRAIAEDPEEFATLAEAIDAATREADK